MLFSDVLSIYYAHRTLSNMAAGAGARGNARLPPEVNRVLFVKNLPFKITPDVRKRGGVLKELCFFTKGVFVLIASNEHVSFFLFFFFFLLLGCVYKGNV